MFKKLFLQFIIIEIIVTAIIIGASFALFKTSFANHYFSFLPVTLAIFIVVNTIIYGIQLNLLLKNPKKFSNFFLLSFLIKFLVYISYFTVYIMVVKEKIAAFTVFFLCAYAIFTTVEVISIVSAVKKNKGK